MEPMIFGYGYLLLNQHDLEPGLNRICYCENTNTDTEVLIKLAESKEDIEILMLPNVKALMSQ